MVPFAIAGMQIAIVAGDENVPAMRTALDVLMHRFPWVQMVVFSELAAFGPSPGHAQPPGGPVEIAFCEMARMHCLWLIPGSYFEQRDGALYNTALAIDPTGAVVARYHKMFPFRPYEAGIAAGTEWQRSAPRRRRTGCSSPLQGGHDRRSPDWIVTRRRTDVSIPA